MHPLIARIRPALSRWWANHQLHTISLDLVATRDQLTDMEEELDRQLPPEIHCDIQREVVDLRARHSALLTERAYWAAEVQRLA